MCPSEAKVFRDAVGVELEGTKGLKNDGKCTYPTVDLRKYVRNT